MGSGERSVAGRRPFPLHFPRVPHRRARRGWRATLLFALAIPAWAAAQPVCESTSAWCTTLLSRCGTNGCAGNTGDYYDNRDGGHTALPGLAEHPQLASISTGFGGQFAAWDSAALAGKVVIGNASVAYVSGSQWGSVARVNFMLSQADASRGYGHYTHNIHYWHPCHLDHPAARDYYHAMTPTISSSQGSSGSEMLEVKKWIIALAAFRPLVKQRLKDAGLLMPTLQMIARRVRVATDAAYLTAAAHPSVFGGTADLSSMLVMANDISPDALPPFANVRVLSDNFVGGNPYIYDSDGGNRRIYDTPASIARIHKDHDLTKWMLVTAEDSIDLNGRPLTYHWSVLRGDAARVRILPQNPQSSVVRIEIDYQPEPVVGSRQSNTVAVAAFVHNGVYYSAPALMSSVLPGQDRVYDTASGRLLRSDYIDEYRMHPRVAHRKAWRSDVFTYLPRNPGGWVRHDGSGGTAEFTRNGLFVAQTDVGGNILQVQDVSNTLQTFGDHEKNVWSAFGSLFAYDGVAPGASFTSPAHGQQVSGMVTVAGNAADNVAVTSVTFSLDGGFLRSFAAPPYSFVWNTAGVPDGVHTLLIAAQDRNRNITEVSIPVQVQNGAAGGRSYYRLTPCRLIDTRGADGPALTPGAPRTFVLPGRCGLPMSAAAVAANVTVTGATASGHVTIQPAGAPLPATSTLNYSAGRTRANNAILALGPAGDVTVHCSQTAGVVHLIIDLTGYLQ